MNTDDKSANDDGRVDPPEALLARLLREIEAPPDIDVHEEQDVSLFARSLAPNSAASVNPAAPARSAVALGPAVVPRPAKALGAAAAPRPPAAARPALAARPAAKKETDAMRIPSPWGRATLVAGILISLIAVVGSGVLATGYEVDKFKALRPFNVEPIAARAENGSGGAKNGEIKISPLVDLAPGSAKTSSTASLNAAASTVTQVASLDAVSPSQGAPSASAAIPAPVASPVRGVTDTEIRFGLVGPFSGPARELGRQMKLGIESAFGQANDAGGIHGRRLRLIVADDGYEPTRTAAAVRQLYDQDQVFGFIGNVGTPTAAVALPFALDHRMAFFGAFTGAGLLRRDPPDRYVFNYRASYEEETEAVVRYLVRVRRVQPNEIVVFAQQDSFGDSGFAGVSKAVRALPGDNPDIVRLGYKRNTIDVADAVSQLSKLRPQPKAVVMVAAYRAAAKFIEKTKDLYPSMIYTNVSFVGSTALSQELMLLGPRFATGVVVTQVVPAVNSYASIILNYKSSLEKYFPGEAPDYVSLEGYVEANIMIEALKRTGPHPDSEALVDQLESMRNYDIGLGSAVTFSPGDHQGVHKVWGTEIDSAGNYQPIDMK